MNWKAAQDIANMVSAGLMVFAFARRSGRTGSARVLSDGQVEFPPDSSAYWEWPLVVLPPALATIGALHRGIHGTFELLTSACIGFLVLAHLFSFPGTIVVTWEGLKQIYWLRPDKRLRWSEIMEIKTEKGRGAVTITGADGTKIVHSLHLVDRPRLLLEIKQHCGENLPPDFPREPMGSSRNL